MRMRLCEGLLVGVSQAPRIAPPQSLGVHELQTAASMQAARRPPKHRSFNQLIPNESLG